MVKMLKCLRCQNSKATCKGTITGGGKKTLVITCKKYGTFQNENDDNYTLPCKEN